MKMITESEYADLRRLGAENERLRAVLQEQGAHDGCFGIHGPGCWRWGRSHYDCAVHELQKALGQLDRVAGKPPEIVAFAVCRVRHILASPRHLGESLALGLISEEDIYHTLKWALDGGKSVDTSPVVPVDTSADLQGPEVRALDAPIEVIPGWINHRKDGFRPVPPGEADGEGSDL